MMDTSMKMIISRVNDAISRILAGGLHRAIPRSFLGRLRESIQDLRANLSSQNQLFQSLENLKKTLEDIADTLLVLPTDQGALLARYLHEITESIESMLSSDLFRSGEESRRIFQMNISWFEMLLRAVSVLVEQDEKDKYTSPIGTKPRKR